MLLNDAYGGHRKWWDPDWEDEPSLVNVWVEWDYILLRVMSYLKDYTSTNGQLVWFDEDPDIDWEISKRVSYHDKDMASFKEDNDVKPWETLTAKPHVREGSEAPSMSKWIKMLEDEQTDSDRPAPGRPPTAEELAAMSAPQGE